MTEYSFRLGKPIKPNSETPALEYDPRGSGYGLSDGARKDIQNIESSVLRFFEAGLRRH